MTIQSGPEFRAPTLTDATVISVSEAQITVRCTGRAGGVYVEHYSRRDGLRAGRGGRRGELVDRSQANVVDRHQQATEQVAVAYRAWSRARRDMEALRALQTAVTDLLEMSSNPP